MIDLFFSYTHKDEDLRDELEIHLTMLKRQGVIQTWHDRRIIAGEEFDKRINHYLEKSDIVLLLVSPHFLASDYCWDIEIARAMDRHEKNECIVIPVILVPCDWHSAPFGKLQAATQDGKPITKYADKNDAFLEIVKQIKKTITKIQSSSLSLSSKPETFHPKVQNQSSLSDASVRSSNLRVKREFSDQEKDEFLSESFNYIATFFESSLKELGTRYSHIVGRFERIDAHQFTAIIYKHGKTAAQCRIYLGNSFGCSSRSIAYSQSINSNSINESLSIDADGYTLYLKALGLSMMSNNQDKQTKWTKSGASELFWELLINRLQ